MGTMNFPKKVVEQVETSSTATRTFLIVGLLVSLGVLIWAWIANGFFVGVRWGFFAASITIVLGQFIDMVDDGDTSFGEFFGTTVVFSLINAVGFIWGAKTFTIVLIILLLLSLG